MNIAVIGTFWLTENFINAIKITDGAKYYAQFSRSMERAEAFAEKHGGAKCFDDLYKMAEDKNIDTVYIASPNMTHYEYTKLFISAGKNVFCEKPITVTPAEHNELCALADKMGVIYAEAMMNYHLPQLDAIKNKLAVSGDVVSARIDFSQRSSKLERVKKGETISTFDKNSCGGALMDLGVYCVYLAAALFGEPSKISASAHFWESGADIADSVILTYDKFDAVLTFTKLAESSARSEIICREGTVSIEQPAQLRGVGYKDAQGNFDYIHRTLTPVECMACELSDFISYKSDENKKSYLEARKTASLVSEIMYEVRKIIGYDISSCSLK
ncbi:MAG: Gfo/Idh/MocA family oxidoreductase [Ruminococcaceae bacterium]|nr:Gfo/Idh/MocA family oxidoreductase [Oscillospiraceae bacterium]